MRSLLRSGVANESVHGQVLVGTKKRRHMTQELLTRFQSKADFVQYFRHQLQLYVPPEKMLNRDFIKQLLTEEKKLLELH